MLIPSDCSGRKRCTVMLRGGVGGGEGTRFNFRGSFDIIYTYTYIL